MKISYNWLKEHLEFDLSVERTCQLLTDCGLEVEGSEPFESIPGGLKGLGAAPLPSSPSGPQSEN